MSEGKEPVMKFPDPPGAYARMNPGVALHLIPRIHLKYFRGIAGHLIRE